MGRVFLIEKLGPAYRCNTCYFQIAQQHPHRDLDVYNVTVSVNVNAASGCEVFCVKCNTLVGWRVLTPAYRLNLGRLTQPM